MISWRYVASVFSNIGNGGCLWLSTECEWFYGETSDTVEFRMSNRYNYKIKRKANDSWWICYSNIFV